MLVCNEDIDIGTSYVTHLKTFQISDYHTDVTAYDLSEKWGIKLAQATKKLNKTTFKFLLSGVIKLSRRYRKDRVFTRKVLQGQWSCHMMNGRLISMDGNQYSQLFVNNSYFSKVYPIDSKRKSECALKLFYQEFCVTKKINFDGSK